MAGAGLRVPVFTNEAPPDPRRGGGQAALRVRRAREARRRLRDIRSEAGLAHREGGEEPGDRRLPHPDAQGGRGSAGRVASGVARPLLRQQQRGAEVQGAERGSAADDKGRQEREEEVEDVYYSVIYIRVAAVSGGHHVGHAKLWFWMLKRVDPVQMIFIMGNHM